VEYAEPAGFGEKNYGGLGIGSLALASRLAWNPARRENRGDKVRVRKIRKVQEFGAADAGKRIPALADFGLMVDTAFSAVEFNNSWAPNRPSRVLGG
jgi:hypothetical protein